MEDKFSLKWGKFQQHTNSTFKDLRYDKEYFDVTLACDDNKDVTAHKVILSSCSPYFRNLLGRNKHPHPLIYMRGMESKHLESILDFMYQGEVDVAQDSLARFLEIADDLKINGLDSSEHTKDDVNFSDRYEDTSGSLGKNQFEQPATPRLYYPNNHLNNLPNIMHPPQPKTPFPGEHEYQETQDPAAVVARYDDIEDDSLIVDDDTDINNTNTPVIAKNPDDDPTALIESLMMKMENGRWQCSVCHKTQKSRNHCREHVEIHIDGLSYACDYCAKPCRTSGALRSHRRQVHTRKQDKSAVVSLE